MPDTRFISIEKTIYMELKLSAVTTIFEDISSASLLIVCNNFQKNKTYFKLLILISKFDFVLVQFFVSCGCISCYRAVG